tara:strand:+ start:1334 stop:2062 length:729 start_codon:yes stop_codon:yes gene_type:complete
MIDSKKRSVCKALTWRLFAIVLLGIVSFVSTGDIKSASMITFLYHGIQFCMFFLHERIWNNISWGKTKGLSIQMTGMSGAGKSTLSNLVAERLKKKGLLVEIIDGDEYRNNLCNDLGFSKEDRNTNIRRLGFVSKVLSRNNVITIIAAINPYDKVRKELVTKDKNLKTVYVKCKMATLLDRDTKGLYKRALLPDGHDNKVYNFTGISDPFEEPKNPDLVIDTTEQNIESAVQQFENFIIKNI